MSVAQRLTQALMAKGRSKHWLHKTLRDRTDPVRGSAYASVRSYCDGTNERPPLEFLMAAAEVLEVREAWLRFGEGEASTVRDGLRAFEEASVGEDAQAGPLLSAEFLEALQEHTKYGPSWLEGMRPVVRVAFADTWHRFSLARGVGASGEGLDAKVGVGLFRILMRPIELVGAGKRMDLSGQVFTDYALAALGAMNQAVRVPRKTQFRGLPET